MANLYLDTNVVFRILVFYNLQMASNLSPHINKGLSKFLRRLNVALPFTKSPEVPSANLSPLHVEALTDIQWDAASRPSNPPEMFSSASGVHEERNNSTQLGKLVLLL